MFIGKSSRCQSMALSYSCLPLRFYRSLLDAPPVNFEPCRILRLPLKYANTIDRHLSDTFQTTASTDYWSYTRKLCADDGVQLFLRPQSILQRWFQGWCLYSFCRRKNNAKASSSEAVLSRIKVSHPFPPICPFRLSRRATNS